MITEEKYLEAVETIRLFNNQIDVKIKREQINNAIIKNTTLERWLEKRSCTTRLKNTLDSLFEAKKHPDRRFGLYECDRDKDTGLIPPVYTDIEKVSQKHFMYVRNAGKNTWLEFVELRGF